MHLLHILVHHPLSTDAIPVYVLSIVLEILLANRPLKKNASSRNRALRGYHVTDTIASLSMGLISLFTVALIAMVTVGFFDFAWAHRVTNLGKGAAGWTAALVLWDFGYYWCHRANHRIRILWANHVQHHSSEFYNLSTALRQSVTSVTEWIFVIPVAWLGVPLPLVATAGAINLIYQFFLHTECIDRLPRTIEFIFNTPSHHRVHHGSNPQYLDKNFGGILIVFDRMFGTFEPEVAPVTYGLTKNIASFNPLVIATHEYASIIRDVRNTSGVADKLRRLVRGPGWQPPASELLAGLPAEMSAPLVSPRADLAGTR